MTDAEPKDTKAPFPIGAQVRYTRPASLYLVKSIPWRIGDKTVIRITGFSEPIPVAHLTRDEGDD
ncbi:hypothetical protein [Hoeflea sp. TYP-13]|uniref:hypothetical protein n=1 Tax=Hoeflea sp. TYP-13 TaxID=3230023 RepID=UPI0034C6C9EA